MNETARTRAKEAIERDRQVAEVAALAEARREKDVAGKKERLQERGADLAGRGCFDTVLVWHLGVTRRQFVEVWRIRRADHELVDPPH